MRRAIVKDSHRCKKKLILCFVTMHFVGTYSFTLTYSCLLAHSLTCSLRLLSVLFTLIIPITNAAGGPSCWIVTSSTSAASSLPYAGGVILYLVPLAAVQCYHVYILYFLVKTLKQIPSVLTHSYSLTLTHSRTYSLTLSLRWLSISVAASVTCLWS